MQEINALLRKAKSILAMDNKQFEAWNEDEIKREKELNETISRLKRLACRNDLTIKEYLNKLESEV